MFHRSKGLGGFASANKLLFFFLFFLLSPTRQWIALKIYRESTLSHTAHSACIPVCSLCMHTCVFTVHAYMCVHCASIHVCSLCIHTCVFTVHAYMCVKWVSSCVCSKRLVSILSDLFF